MTQYIENFVISQLEFLNQVTIPNEQGEGLRQKLINALNQLAEPEASPVSFFIEVEKLLLAIDCFHIDQLEIYHHVINVHLSLLKILEQNKDVDNKGCYFKIALRIYSDPSTRPMNLISLYIEQCYQEIYKFRAELGLSVQPAFTGNLDLRIQNLRIELAELISEILKVRKRALESKDVEEIQATNQRILQLNTILRSAHQTYSWFVAYNDINLVSQIEGLPLVIREVDINSPKNYSSFVYLNYGFSEHRLVCEYELWTQQFLHDRFYYLNIEDGAGYQMLSQFPIDNYTKLHITGHGCVGTDYIAPDGINIHQKIYYTTLAQSIASNLTQEQLFSLRNKDNPQYLRIRLSACSAGKGRRRDGSDSFAAKLHRELLIEHGIYSEVTASTASTVTPRLGVRTHSLTPMHGFESSMDALKAKSAKALSDYYTQQDKHGLVKHSEYQKLVDKLLIKRQSGSKVVFKWGEDGKQVREDAYRGGSWRALVYDDIVNCINRTKVERKVRSLNQLLARLDTMDEPGILRELRAIANPPEPVQYTYSINSHSRWYCFFMKTTTRDAIDNLITEGQSLNFEG